jgi:superoxide dismutase
MKTKAFLIITIALGILTVNNKIMAQNYTFPELPYAYNALEPYIDAQTMEIHYTKHHRAYFDNFVKAAGEAKIDNLPLEDIFTRMSIYSATIRNNGGGLYNHMLFWNIMGPNAGGQPEGDLLKAIEETFGSFDKFKANLRLQQRHSSEAAGHGSRLTQTANCLFRRPRTRTTR